MFSENKSELSIPVVGFLLLGFAALFAAIAVFNSEWDFLSNGSPGVSVAVYAVSGLLLVIGAFFAFKQVFLIEGVMFGIFGIFLLAFGLGAAGANLVGLGLLGFILSVLAAILAFMSYRVGDIYILLMAVFSIVAFMPLYFADGAAGVAISGIGMIAVAALALVYAVMDWMLVQDVASEIADYMYGDDDEEHACGCGCEEHDD